MAIRPYITQTEVNLIITMLIQTGNDKTIAGNLLARKLGGGESKDKMEQQTLRHRQRLEDGLGLGLSTEASAQIDLLAKIYNSESSHIVPQAITQAKITAPIETPEQIDEFSEEEIQAMIDACDGII